MTNTSYSKEKAAVEIDVPCTVWLWWRQCYALDKCDRFTKYIIQCEHVHVSLHDKIFEDTFHLFSPKGYAENLRPASISPTNNHFMVMKFFQQRPEIHL